jgi:glycosyltransferase involved in cell wall biosynthesis
MKLSFVIPVFNEEASLEILCDEIKSVTAQYEYEIIFIDDGSTDKSYQILKTLAEKDPNLKVVKFRRNFGKSAALNVGFKKSKGEIVFTMDADLQDNPSDIPAFIQKINDGWDVVTGWKRKRKDPLSKRIPSKLFNRVVSFTFGLRLHDYNCGFKAYRREVLYEIDVYGEMHRYIPALALAKGFRVTEIPVNHRARSFGKSKYGFERYLRGCLDLLTVKLVTQFNRSPLYLFGGIGTLLSGAGFLIGLYLSALKILNIAAISNRPLLFLAILLIIVGLQFISIGLIGELLINQSRKINKNDTVSIQETVNFP